MRVSRHAGPNGFALPAGSTDSVIMFTLEDLDIQAGLAELLAANPDLLSLSGHPTPEADVRLHPEDYFVVGA